MRYFAVMIGCWLTTGLALGLAPVSAVAQDLGRVKPEPPAGLEAIRPRSYVFQIAEIRTAEAAPVELTSAEVLKWLEEAQKSGQIEFLETVRLTAVEDQKSLAQFGRSVEVVKGDSQTTEGKRQNRERREFGTIVNLVAKSIGDTVGVELGYDAARPGDGADGGAAEMTTTQVRTKLIVEPGKPTLVTAKSSKSGTYLVLILEK